MLLRALCITPPVSRSAIIKTLRIMKITSILILAACLHMSARSYSQVTLSGKNVPLQEVFKQIKQQTGYDFLYNAELIQQAGKVNVDVKNVSIEKALELCLKDKLLTYLIIEKTVVIKPKDPTNLAEQVPPPIDIRGRVLNEKGEPVEAVTVTVKGTGLATATLPDGTFILKSVSTNAILVLTSVNIENIEIKVNGRNDIDITVKTKVRSIEEVTISTGYQTISKERSSGSFSKPNLDIARNRSTSMNVLQRLDGLVPGLTVNNAPGAETILVRGLTSINATRAPLYVVDGIPMNDIASINPQDISDITILKDATAASIWGSRASNGVVVIVTRKGSQSEKIKVNYDGFINFQGKSDLNYIPVLNSPQFIQAAKDIFDPIIYPWNIASGYTNTGSVGVPPHEMILYNQSRGIISAAQASSSLDSLASINNVQQIEDVWYRKAVLMNHTVSLSGGGRINSFYGSLAYTDLQSNRPGEKNNTFKANLRQDFNLGKRIQLYLITDLTNATTKVKRTITIDNRFLPYQLFKDANGNNLSTPYMAYLSDSTRIAYENRSRISLDYNPLNEFDYGYTKSDALLSRIVSGVSVKLIKGLRYEGVFGFIKGTNKTTSFDSDKSYLVRSELVQFTVAATPSATPVYYLPTAGGRYTVTNVNQRNWTVRNQMVYDNSWKNKLHQLIALVGQEAQEQLTNSNRSTVRGYNESLQTYGPVDYVTLGSTGVISPVMANNTGKSVLSNDAFQQTESQTKSTSYYANAAYTYNRKYALNASWRLDKSNLFGIDKSAQSKPVWSIGAKWMMSDEKFMSDVKWLDRFALRATYGITGNSPIPGQASSYDILSAQSSTFLPGGVGLRVNTPGNAKLTWETTKTINLGFDFSVFENRLNGYVDVYSKKTDNLIGYLPVNSFTGYSFITGNFGDMKNHGVELSLSSINISKKNFTWQTMLTGAYNKNTVTKLNYLNTPITTGQQKIQQRYLAGYSAFTVFSYQYAGLDTLGDPMIYLNNKTVTKSRNAAMPDDVIFSGTYQPKWSGGVSNIFAYREFSLSINAVYNLGHVMRRDVNSFYTGRLMTTGNFTPSASGFTTGNLPAEFKDRWKQRGDELITLIPSYVSSNSISTTRRDVTYYTKADVNVVSASYIKLRDITLSYSLPKQILNHIKTDNVTFRVQLSNILLWKANKYGIDPEFQESFLGIRNIRSNQGTITVGVHVTF